MSDRRTSRISQARQDRADGQNARAERDGGPCYKRKHDYKSGVKYGKNEIICTRCGVMKA